MSKITRREPGTATRSPAGPGPGKVMLMTLKEWANSRARSSRSMIHLGDRLGLYRATAGSGLVTAGVLASRTGLNPRWLLERLRCQAAAALADSPDGKVFELGPQAAAPLAGEEISLWLAAGAPSAVSGAVGQRSRHPRKLVHGPPAAQRRTVGRYTPGRKAER